jgi:hypothetical protein
MEALEIIFCHCCEFNIPELEVDRFFCLFYIGNIAEITEEVIDVSI